MCKLFQVSCMSDTDCSVFHNYNSQSGCSWYIKSKSVEKNEWKSEIKLWINCLKMNECAIWATGKKMMNENKNDQQMRKTQIFSYLSC